MADISYMGSISLSLSPFTTRLTSGAALEACENNPVPYSNYDFIDFLGLAQRLGIHFLPISWQGPYVDLGRGGQAEISQVLFNLQISFAFKSFKATLLSSKSGMQELINEIVVLSHPRLKEHRHIANVEGICWDILQDGRVVPVLVFEKAAYGDLEHFLTSGDEGKLDLADRLNLCVDIGIAVRDMHRNGIIHGDLKPKNVLVFREESGLWLVKVTDFGYATRFCGDEDTVKLPKSIPWNAPEHHIRHFSAANARRMDVYSFGVLCLWLLFEGIPGSTSKSSFKDLLENCAQEECFRRLALEVVHDDDRLDEGSKNRLRMFFEHTLARDPDVRSDDFDHLVGFLAPEREITTPLERLGFEEVPEYESFELAVSFYEFYSADFRLRTYITNELCRKSASALQKSPPVLLRNTALQVALCYYLGFGVPVNTAIAQGFLDQFGIPEAEVNLKISLIREVDLQREIRGGLVKQLAEEGYLADNNLPQHYREHGQIEAAIETYTRDIVALKGALGATHPLVFLLRSQLAKILRDIGCLTEAEAIDNDTLKLVKTLPIDTAYEPLVNSMMNLASTLQELGRVKEAEDLKIEVLALLRRREKSDRPVILTALANLAAAYRNQDQWGLAHELEVDILKRRIDTLGPDHIDTLSSKSNLANTLWKQGKWAEAEEMEKGVVAVAQRVLGSAHPLTLQWMWNLSSTYQSQGRLQEALLLGIQVMDAWRKSLGTSDPKYLTLLSGISTMLSDVGLWADAETLQRHLLKAKEATLGPYHPSTLTIMNNLAANLHRQEKLEEAEVLESKIIEISSKVLGSDHLDTLISESNLANIYRKQKRWKEAETLSRRVLEVSIKKFGEDHPDTISSLASLGAILVSQGSYSEAEVSLSRVVEQRKQLLGERHPSTLISMGNLAMVYQKQNRGEEAVELDTRVYELRKTLLGPDHPDTLTSMYNLAISLKALGESHKSLELMSDCARRCTETLGAGHQRTAESVEYIQLWQSEKESGGV